MGTNSDCQGRAEFLEYEQRARVGAGAMSSGGDVKLKCHLCHLWWRQRQIVVSVKPCIGCSLDLNIFWAVTVE